jgi:hypothetical protein
MKLSKTEKAIEAHKAKIALAMAQREESRLYRLIWREEAKLGDDPFSPRISGGFREHWPESIKNELRTGWRKVNSLRDDAVRHWKASGKRTHISTVIDGIRRKQESTREVLRMLRTRS